MEWDRQPEPRGRTNVASGTQCLHADASGNITGTGTDCGSSISSATANAYSFTTTAAGGYVAAPGSALVINCYGNPIMLTVTGYWSNNGGNTNYLALLLDGATYNGQAPYAQSGGMGAATTGIPFGPAFLTAASGNHTVEINPYTAGTTLSATIIAERLTCVH